MGLQLYGGHVIDPALVDQMTQRKVYNAEATIFDQYGLGTMRAYLDGQWVFGHLGDMEVYTSMLMVWPDTGTAVAALVPQPVGWTGDNKAELGISLRSLVDAERGGSTAATPRDRNRSYEVSTAPSATSA